MRRLALAALALLLPSAASAQSALAPECVKLQLVDSIQLASNEDGTQDYAPLSFDGGKNQKLFLFNTTAGLTSITYSAAKQAGLSTTGLTTPIPRFIMGHMVAERRTFLLEPDAYVFLDGNFGPDYLSLFDADIDFGTDILNFFSPDHCQGAVQYWKADSVDIIPIEFDRFKQLIVPIELDGQKLTASLSTGSWDTRIQIDTAEDKFDLNPGDKDTPKNPAPLPENSYVHVFKNLKFGGVSVGQVPVALRHVQTYSQVQIYIGMNILRKLYIYFAFKEKKMYISSASEPALADIKPFPPSYLAAFIDASDRYKASRPDDPALLATACWVRGQAKTDLDQAIAFCDQSLKIKPDLSTQYYKAFVLYRQNKFQEAADILNPAIASGTAAGNVKFLHGLIRKALGDTDGGAADMAEASKKEPYIPVFFKRVGVLN